VAVTSGKEKNEVAEGEISFFKSYCFSKDRLIVLVFSYISCSEPSYYIAFYTAKPRTDFLK